MDFHKFFVLVLCSACVASEYSKNNDGTDRTLDSVSTQNDAENKPPEGYYAFIESPNAEPPKVRPPPYEKIDRDCYDKTKQEKGHVSIHNICGDLNKGYIPRNPMNQNIDGSSYPFELIRNHTLKFLSRTLPILKSDDSLPKVAKVQSILTNSVETEKKRSSRAQRSEPFEYSESTMKENDKTSNTSRNARKFCENGGIMCMLYKAIHGEPSSPQVAERREETLIASPEHRQRTPPQEKQEYSGPPTPCPAKVEYATPVFAKNYQGVWRYVVQIPYEGYFTQTIEVTRCMEGRCHYLDGGCLSSPRWTSLLVAEIFYPETFLEENQDQQKNRLPGPPRNPVTVSPPPVHDFQNYQQYLQKRAGESEGRSSSGGQQNHCDGVDEMGCLQVRLYYDWFLVPGSCKCWRPDYFNRYLRRSNPSPEL